MSNETDLDWLARNVHEWPGEKTYKIGHKLFVGGAQFHEHWASYVSPVSGALVKLNKYHWLSRRAELQNKPTGWPDGANWLAQDKDGEWYFYKDAADNPPQNHGEENWFSDEAGDIRCRRIGEVLGDWRDTLEKRPEQDEFLPFVSIEDSQEKEMKQNDGWFERGELPPVGVVCEAYIDYPPQWVEAEIVAHKDGFAIGWCKSVMKGCHGDKAGEFRPIRTERDVLLSIIVEEMNRYDTDGKLADAILAAGFSLRDK